MPKKKHCTRDFLRLKTELAIFKIYFQTKTAGYSRCNPFLSLSTHRYLNHSFDVEIGDREDDIDRHTFVKSSKVIDHIYNFLGGL